MRTVTFQGKVLHLEGTLPVVGAKIPAFNLTANDLSLRTQDAYAGKILVFVTVPSLDTPVCDMEARRFNSEAAQLSDKTQIVVVSRDLPFAQSRWCGAAGAKSVETLSDYRNGAFGQAYGVYLQELDLLARAVFVVAPDLTLSYVQLVQEVTHEPDYAAVLEAVKKLV